MQIMPLIKDIEDMKRSLLDGIDQECVTIPVLQDIFPQTLFFCMVWHHYKTYIKVLLNVFTATEFIYSLGAPESKNEHYIDIPESLHGPAMSSQ